MNCITGYSNYSCGMIPASVQFLEIIRRFKTILILKIMYCFMSISMEITVEELVPHTKPGGQA